MTERFNSLMKKQGQFIIDHEYIQYGLGMMIPSGLYFRVKLNNIIIKYKHDGRKLRKILYVAVTENVNNNRLAARSINYICFDRYIYKVIRRQAASNEKNTHYCGIEYSDSYLVLAQI